MELAADLTSAVANRNPKVIASTAPSVVKFLHQRRGLYSGKITN